MIKFLYFDTCAVIKYFVNEKGSDIVKEIIKSHSKYNYSLYTSQVTQHEFKRVLKKKAKKLPNNPEYLDDEKCKFILHRIRNSIPQLFHIADTRDLKQKTYVENWADLKKKHNLKDEGDARHYATMLNYLGFLANVKFVSSDRDFYKIVEKEGYEIIDPEKISINDLKTFWE